MTDPDRRSVLFWFVEPPPGLVFDARLEATRISDLDFGLMAKTLGCSNELVREKLICITVQSVEVQVLASSPVRIATVGAVLETANNCSFDALVLPDHTKAVEFGRRLFGRVVKDANLIRTSLEVTNGQFEYFPNFLAGLGAEGMFLEERIENALRRITALTPGQRVVEMRDLGGWESLDHLSASMDLVVQNEDMSLEVISVIGTAVVPIPPISVVAEEVRISALEQMSRSLGGYRNILYVGRGVVVHRRVSSFRSAFASAAEPERLSLIASASALAALTMSAEAQRLLPGTPAFGAWVDSETRVMPEFLDCLGAHEGTACWSRLDVDPRLFSSSSFVEAPLDRLGLELSPREHALGISSLNSALSYLAGVQYRQ